MRTILTKRLLSVFLCIALIASYTPITALAATVSSDHIDRVSDPSTMDTWRDFFLPDGNISTEHAGRVWTDKSVFTANPFQANGITMDDANAFLVALSAMATNMSVTGMTHMPTDSMLILDVSGSMNDGDNDVAEDLVLAANTSIKALLESNNYNRVGVVLYSGSSNSNTNNDAAIVMLPLGRYTTAADGQYLNYEYERGWFSSTETILLDSDVRIEGTSTAPSSSSKEVVGATYIQKGITAALNQFVAEGNATTVNGLQRKPVMVLMSDGAPSLGSTNFTSPGQYNLGSGSGTSAALGFVSQLTASYAKNALEEKYGTSGLFYTIGLGVSNDAVALSVLDPDNTGASVAVNDFWTTWNNTATGGSVTVQTGSNGNNARTVTKMAGLNQNYVDQFINIDSTDSSTSLGDKLTDAFDTIVDNIILQSKYTPTLISQTGENHSGFISFVDKVGNYMQVTDVKGILINNTLYSGADMASNFVAGGGNLGTFDNPTELGHEMVASVRQRLGLANDDEARTLIGLAYEYGQLRYNSPTDFSNYIGWYADGNNNFLGFYQEGVTNITDPNAVYTIKSYGYLGVEHDSNMMYATVQVRHNIQTGEETVAFAVPAALIPVMSYNVSLDGNGDLLDIEVTGSQSPIRLVYEVALDSHINQWNVLEKVSDTYLQDPHHYDAQTGEVNFYTNLWEHTNTTGYTTVNTYSYFNPSRQNESYYYTSDAPVYTDTNGTLYTGSVKPDENGVFYRAYTVYEETSAGLSTKTAYHQIPGPALETAEPTTGTNNWHIPSGNVRVSLDGEITKNPNATDTLSLANEPFVDVTGHHINDTDHIFYIGATLGNNGKLTLTPQTGIKLSKVLADGATATDSAFEFNLQKAVASASQHRALLVNADGTEREATVEFDSNGSASVSLKAGQSLYIGDLDDGEIITIAETETAGYIPSVTVGGIAVPGSAVVTVSENEMTEVIFTNADRGTGNLTIGKEVVHDFGANYQIPADKVFTMQVTLSGIGTANASFRASHTNGTYTAITTDGNGQFSVTLKHDEQFEVFGLPVGTVAKVVEVTPGAGFTPAYWNNAVLSSESYGQVTVGEDTTVSVIVANDYTAAEVFPVNITVTGTKHLSNATWQPGYSFDFKLEKLLADGSWQPLGNIETATSANDGAFAFTDALASERYPSAGTYYYRITEIEPGTPLPGFAYDKTVHSFAVHVGDTNMDGQLEITEVVSDRPNTTVVTQTANGWNVNANFTNTYSTSGSATVTIDVNKAITNIGGAEKNLAGFEFGLFDANGTQVGATLTTTERGFARFVLTYNAEDMNASVETFQYTLKEIAPNPVPTGWTYSPVEVPVTVEVSDTGAGTITAVIYQGSTKPANAGTSISTNFTNEYDPVDATLSVNFVKKQMVGRDFRADDDFTFELVEINLPAGANPRRLSGTLDLASTANRICDVNFGTLTFDKVGTYAFEIRELGADGDGVTVDRTVYQILVTVTDVNGQLVADHSVLNAAGDEIVFVNTYEPESTTYTIIGQKNLTGRTLINDEFTFVLTEALNAQGQIADGAKTYEAHNEFGGVFAFPEITYTAAGTYHYVVTEKQASGSSFGILYDTTKYVVTVTVTDDTEHGKLVASANLDSDDIVFNNSYVPASVAKSVDGKKILTGKALADGEFSFQLWQANDQWQAVGSQPIQTVTNDADGNLAFGFVDYTNGNATEFSAAGSYYYLIKEVNGGQTIGNITYDAIVYRVRIDITDDLLGQLHATAHIYDDAGIPQESIEFYNIFTPDPEDITVHIGVEKTVVNKGSESIGPDGFQFQLENVATGEKVYVTTNAEGKAIFDLEYTKNDIGQTYTYKVTEVNGGKANVTYSTAAYTVTVEISLNGDNELVATLTKNGQGAAEVVTAFENVYDYTPAPTPEPTPESPKTGDSTYFQLWSTLLFVSGGGIFTTAFYTRKKKNGETEEEEI